VLSVRPKVAELQFSLFGRALHPELFEVCRTQVVRRGGYEARIDITNAGHVVTWTHDGLTLTEVAATANHPLPEARRLFRRRLHGHRQHRLEWRRGITYQVCFQLEPADPAIFWMFQQELARDGRHRGMLHTFESSGRLAMGALSYIYAETRNRSLSLQSFHTFPDDCAIVKIQSLIELP
jgi:hypothetical protein